MFKRHQHLAFYASELLFFEVICKKLETVRLNMLAAQKLANDRLCLFTWDFQEISRASLVARCAEVADSTTILH